jgi:hypothetical protein
MVNRFIGAIVAASALVLYGLSACKRYDVDDGNMALSTLCSRGMYVNVYMSAVSHGH